MTCQSFSAKKFHVAVLALAGILLLWGYYCHVQRVSDEKLWESIFEVSGSLDLPSLLSERIPVVLIVGGEGCGSCEKTKLLLMGLHKKLRGEVLFRYLDIWKHPHLEGHFPSINVVPTFFFFNSEGQPFVPKNPEESGMQKFMSVTKKIHTWTSLEGVVTEDELLDIAQELKLPSKKNERE